MILVIYVLVSNPEATYSYFSPHPWDIAFLMNFGIFLYAHDARNQEQHNRTAFHYETRDKVQTWPRRRFHL